MAESQPKTKALQTPFGLLNGRIVSAQEVQSGLACGCICPGCGTALVAKHGSTNRKWHFAHYAVVANLSCVESAIHAAAKQILLDEIALTVPSKKIMVHGVDSAGNHHSLTQILTQSKNVKFDFCIEELWQSQIRPDVVGIRGDKRMYIEMYFTHKVDEIKLSKLNQLGVASLEIDLSKLPHDASYDDIKQNVLHNLDNKWWLYCPGEHEALSELQTALEKKISLANKKILKDEEIRKNRIELHKQKLALTRQYEDAEHADYRALPLAIKDQYLRKQLGISDPWPYYLNKRSPEANAINELPKIWQASLFSQFIFMKPNGTIFQIGEAIDWVARRFETKDLDAAGSVIAQYLRYLRACGFIELSPYNPYEAEFYKVAHSLLTPPTKFEKRAPNKETARPPVKSEPVMQRILTPHWIWSARWPAPEEISQKANIPIFEIEFKANLKELVQLISFENRAQKPEELAIEFEKTSGVPSENTLQFLVDIGLAIKTKKTIFKHL